MTLEEAIEILKYQGPPENGPTIRAFVEAKKLGIEAIKDRLERKKAGYIDQDDLLPGETED